MATQSTDDVSLPSLVSSSWLSSRLGDPDVVVLDCSWYLPGVDRDADSEFRAAHIPGAARFDLDVASDADTDLPHMLPTAEKFADIVERLGIRNGDTVICYDGSGFNMSAARVWWVFRVFGHERVAVLDGGFASWSSATRPVQRGISLRTPTGYSVRHTAANLVRNRSDIEAMVNGAGPSQLADCRPAARFRGEVDEPRPGLRRGHVPGAKSVPFSEFTDSTTGLMKSPAALRALLLEAGIDIERPMVAMCGSGTSAGVMALAVEVVRESGGRPVGPPVAIYDGSWSEWGRTA